MSLIHWWPLTGDTQDRITNTQLTNNGATTSSNGKIGLCYTFNGSTNLTTPYSTLNTLGSNPAQFSFAFWIKLNSTWTGWGQVFTIGRNGGAWTDIRIGFDVANDKTGYFTISDGSTAISYSGPKHILTLGKWYHIAATFDNKEMKLFINGQPASTPQATVSILPNLSSDTIIAIGGNGGENGECDINDVRIYDHVLSQMEIKELSKALVVHYTFNDVCAEPTTNIITGIQSASGKASLESGRVKINWSPSGGDSYFMFSYNQTIKANSVYTLSFDCEGLKSGEVATFAVSNLSAASYNIALKNGRNSLTFTASSDLMNDINTYNRLFFDDKNRTDGAIFYLSNFQLEERDHATPYTPTSRESMLVNEAGCSGNGTLYNSNLVTDTASGSLSCHTPRINPANTNGNVTTTNSAFVYADVFGYNHTPTEFTVVWWWKVMDWGYGTGPFGLVTSNGSYMDSTLGVHDGAVYVNFAGGDTRVARVFIGGGTGEWTHFAITFKPGSYTSYINGVSQGTATTDISLTLDPWRYLYLGAGCAGGVLRDGDIYWGDFRYYNTCLSTSDIQELYKTKAYITDKGDIMCGEFNSRDTAAQVTSKYEIKCTGIVENSADYNILDYINFSISAPGIDTGIAPGRNLVFDTTVSNIGGSNPYIITQGNYGLRVGGSQFVNFVYGRRFRSSKNISQKNSIQGSDSYLIVDGSMGTQETDSDSPSGNVILFKNQGNNVTSGYLYNCTLMNQDVIVRDFIPVQRKSDNAIGLLDLIENKFYTCSGISAGPLKASNEASIFEDGHISGREIIEI